MGIKNVVVTGSDGYIGSVLVKELINKEYQVTGIDSFFYHTARFEPEINHHTIKKDIRNITEDDLSGVDAIIHLAALSNDALGELHPSLTETINYKATIRLARLAKKAGVKRFIFSSSCSVYGISVNERVDETSETHPLTMYAKTKIHAEQELAKLADDSFCVGLLRNATVYGYSPSFRNDLVINNFVTCAYALGEIFIESDGTPWRPLIDVRDLSRIFVEFLKIEEKVINGKIINIGFFNNNIQIKDLLHQVKIYLPTTKITYTGTQPDSRSYRVDFTVCENIFPSIKQQWHFDRSIKDMIEKLKKKQYSKEDFLLKKHARLSELKHLLEKKHLSKKLFWI